MHLFGFFPKTKRTYSFIQIHFEHVFHLSAKLTWDKLHANSTLSYCALQKH